MLQSKGISKGRNAERIPDSKVGISSAQPNNPSKREVSPKTDTTSKSVSSRSIHPYICSEEISAI